MIYLIKDQLEAFSRANYERSRGFYVSIVSDSGFWIVTSTEIRDLAA